MSGKSHFPITWSIVHADIDDVKAGTAKKVGQVMSRTPKAIGPISPDHNHWDGWHLSLTEDQAVKIALALENQFPNGL